MRVALLKLQFARCDKTIRALEDLERRSQLHIAHGGSVLIAEFGAATVADLDALQVHQASTARKQGGKITMMSVVDVTGTAGRIEDDVRKKSVEAVRQLGPICLGSASLVLDPGLRGTVVRMFMAEFHLASKTPFQQKTFSSLDDALKWMMQLPGQNEDPGRLSSELIKRHFELP